MEDVNAAQISERFVSVEIAEKMAPGYKPPNLGAAAATHAKSRGVSNFANATHQNS